MIQPDQEQSVCEKNNFNALYKDNARPLRNFIYYRCGDIAKAEDFTQEAMISLWENCMKVQFQKAKSFLYTVARNLIIDESRHNKVKLAFIKQDALNERPEDPSYIMEKKEFEKKLEEAISDLPETQRETFLMNRVDKMTFAEIAEALDISVKAVEKRMHLALSSLKEKIGELKFIKI
ncbi:MAG TPA: sigma-70 family RNA polymerase sigma factor [Flavobacteriales bacterium]|nr:sigma-70 family RNA polymerase sigma factor [Flavobacteriales bacterium]